MFFENQQALLSVVNVLYLTTGKNAVARTGGLNYYALSFRKKADTVLFYDGKRLSLSGKSVLLVPMGLAYERRASNEEMIVIHFLAVGLQTDGFRIFYPEQADVLEKLFEEILRVWTGKEAGYALKAGQLLFEILYRIAQEEQRQQGEDPIAVRAAAMIRKSAEQPGFSVSLLAPALNVSGAYLRRCFREEYRMSPKEYLTHVRLETAKSLLDTGYFSVREVAGRSGFENEKYFSTVFKRHFGMPPAAYARLAASTSPDMSNGDAR